MRAANEVARFLLELAALAAYGYAAAQLVDGPGRVVLGAVAVVVVVAIWGVLVAPKASRRLPDPARLAIEVVVFVGAGVALAAAGGLWLGVVLAVLGVANAVSLRFHEQVLGALGPS